MNPDAYRIEVSLCTLVKIYSIYVQYDLVISPYALLQYNEETEKQPKCFEAGNRNIADEVRRLYIAIVDWEKCTGCGDCINACPVNCFEMSDGKSLPHRSSYCINCGTCKEVSPADAIIISIGWGG